MEATTIASFSRTMLPLLLALCIGSGQIGFFHLGLLADWLGAAPAVGLMAAEGLIALALVALWMRHRP